MTARAGNSPVTRRSECTCTAGQISSVPMDRLSFFFSVTKLSTCLYDTGISVMLISYLMLLGIMYVNRSCFPQVFLAGSPWLLNLAV